MLAAQADAAEREVEGVAGGGVVRIRATGTGQVLAVTIAPEVVDPDDVGMLEDLVIAALHDVNARLMELPREAIVSLGALFGGARPVPRHGPSSARRAQEPARRCAKVRSPLRITPD